MWKDYFKESDYIIDFKIYSKSKPDKIIEEGNLFTSSKLVLDVFLKFFHFLRYQQLGYLNVKNFNSEIEGIVQIMFNKFALDNLDEEESFEKAFLEYIDKIKHFKPPFSIDELKDALISIKKEKIDFFQDIFNKYKRKKETIDIQLKKKLSNQDKNVEEANEVIQHYFDKKH